ncbi:MAG: Do family serine endopeptidase [Candidatus Eisenbacteria sp.]|nr:Do family serine endopeptidase [Candidatus Eisenbacteria bacterium]
MSIRRHQKREALPIAARWGTPLALSILIALSSLWFNWAPSSLRAEALASPGSPDPRETAAALGQAFSRIAEDVLPSVVTITSERVITLNTGHSDTSSPFPDFFRRFMPLQPGGGRPQEFRQQGLGSGIIVDAGGIILTANHVVQDAEHISVILSDDQRFDAEVVGTDPDTDVAVLRVHADNPLPAAPIGDSEVLNVGEWVLALGNPFDLGLRGTVTAGIVSATGRSGINLTRYEDFIQTDAAINPGNSGGPLVNLRGEVIGINSAIATRTGGYQGIGFAIPMALVQPVMESILADGHVVRGWLGVYIDDLDDSLREAFGMDADQTGGVLIQQIQADSPAEGSDLQDGDIILAMEGTPIKDRRDLQFRVAETRPGTTVTFTIQRDGQRKQLDVKLGELDRSATLAQASGGAHDPLKDLGLDVADLNEQWRARLSVDENLAGVVVTGVARHSSAAEADLRVGDLIVEASRESVTSVRQLRSIVSRTDPDSVLLLKVVTESMRRFVALRLPE